MRYTLPVSVEIDGKEFAIRNKCDYRVVLDVFEILNDNDLDEEDRLKVALFVFYESGELEKIHNYQKAVEEMFVVLNGGEKEQQEDNRPRLMDWEHDFKVLVAPLNRVLGCEIRTAEYIHWWTVLSGYMEIGECLFSNIVSIRKKRATGKKLEKWEQDFYKENRKMVDLPQRMTNEEKEWLDSDW